MKSTLLLVGFLAAMLTSCTTYKAGQTPDDVYYSPAKAVKERAYTQSRHADRYEDYISREDDQYLRMKTRNRERWSTIDDYDYWYDSRYVPSYSYNYYRNNWNSLYLNNWNTGYYQPYGYGIYGNGNGGIYPNYYGNGYGNRYGYSGYGYSGYGGSYSKTPVYITKRPVEVNRPELNGYNNRSYNNRNSLGNTILKAFTPSNSENSYNNSNTRTYSGNSSSNTYSAPERTYTPSSSSSSSSSSSGSSGGGVSRPARNGGN